MMPGRDGGDWATSVSELVGLFRDALLALIPVFERAHIPWRDGESYDQWDEVGAVLFDKLVREPLTWALDDGPDLSLLDYDLAVPTWSGRSFVAVRHPMVPGDSTAVLLRFETRLAPLDTVAVGLIDGQGAGAAEKRVPVDEASFVVVDRRHGRDSIVSSVLVPE